jgi:hypothetical protein
MSRERSLDLVRRAAYTVDNEQRRTSGRRPVIARPWREHVALAAIEAAARHARDVPRTPINFRGICPFFRQPPLGTTGAGGVSGREVQPGQALARLGPTGASLAGKDLEAERSSLAEQRELL